MPVIESIEKSEMSVIKSIERSEMPGIKSIEISFLFLLVNFDIEIFKLVFT